MMIKICPICKKTFKHWKSEKRVTCSNVCMGKYRQGKNHPNYKDGKRVNINEERICQFCGKKYIAVLAGSKYCSRLCGAKANEFNLKMGNGVPKWGQIKGGKTHKGKYKTEEFKQMQRERMLKGGAAKARKANSQGTTKIEKILYSILDDMGLSYEKEKIISYHAVDTYIPKKRLIIEADGNYWHNYPYGTIKDKYQTMNYKLNGYNILRFWESELKNNLKEVKNAIRKVG